MTLGGRALAGVVLACGLAVVAAGCGGSSTREVSAGPDSATRQCRAQWQDLADRLQGRDDRTDPSDLASRWESVIAAVSYYAEGATAQDCGATLRAERHAIDRIEDFSAQLRRFDIGHRFGEVAPGAMDYLANASSSRATKPERHTRPRLTGRQVRSALATVRQEAPGTLDDLQDGWAEADSVDLTDQRARRKVLADLRFLAGDSARFQACVHALHVLGKAARLAHPAPAPASGTSEPHPSRGASASVSPR